MPAVTKIIFAHGGQEAYPEIAAYRAFFAGAYETSEARPEALTFAPPSLDFLHNHKTLSFRTSEPPKAVREDPESHLVSYYKQTSKWDSGFAAIAAPRNDKRDTAVWMIMGFYPRRPKAGLVIHDYRSLSVGKLWWIKDRLKRYGNARPDIRIFQNEAMREAMGFHDRVPHCLLPMGVPPFVLDYRPALALSYVCDFCYIGVMSAERRTHEMLDSFVRRFGKTKTFHLYGQPEAFLVSRYKDYPNIVFCGRKSQPEVFAALSRARVAVNYFPNHPPHRMQTPTKFLEYAALGCRVLCNEQPQSRASAARYGLACQWGAARDLFAAVPDDLESWPSNVDFIPAPLLWPNVIAQSGIAELIKKMGGEG